jgi:PadR family transcriptional regulator, regulatory protein PadR
MTDIQQLRKGSTPMLILSVLAEEKQHGYAIMRQLEQRSEGYFSMTAALLYPTLHQMEQDGLVISEWEQSGGQHKRKVYAITPAGRQSLVRGQAEWRKFVERLFKTMGRPVDLHMGNSQ